MSMQLTDSRATELTLLQHDEARCAAINDGDIVALDRLMHARLTHVHQTGNVVDKAEFLYGIVERPRKVTRRGVRVVILGDAAVMTGEQTNVLPERDPIRLFVTQLWVREGNMWQQVSFHCCKQTHGI